MNGKRVRAAHVGFTMAVGVACLVGAMVFGGVVAGSSAVAGQEEPQPRPEEPDPAVEPDPEERPAEEPRPRRRPVLGVMLSPTPGDGVLISRVRPLSPAARAGIRRGDFILSIEGESVTSPEDAHELLRDKQPGDEIEIVAWRDGEEISLNVTLQPPRRIALPQFPPHVRPEEMAWLGVMLREPEQEGAEIARLYPDGPAHEAGLRRGDVVIRIGEQEINSPDDLIDALEQKEPDEEVELVVLRNDEEHTLTATLGRRLVLLIDRPRSRMERENAGDVDDGEALLDDVAGYGMIVEQHGRLAEQHQRLELLMLRMLDEIQSLRRQVQESPPREPRPLSPPQNGARDI